MIEPKEDIIDTPEETPDQESNYSDFNIASKDSVQEKFGVLKEGRQVVIPIDEIKKTAIFLTIKDPTVDEALKLLKQLGADDNGNIKVPFDLYYEECWNKFVKSRPRLTWKEVKRYDRKFLQIIMKELPSLNDVLAMEIREEDKKKS